jgi:hypothetical protein
MGLGRTTRFAPLPPGASRVSVMRRGTAGLPVLAPSVTLLEEFERTRRALRAGGLAADRAHAEAANRIDYRRRFVGEIRGSGPAMAAFRAVIARARSEDVYLMCMCPYMALERACHSYLLLDLAAELAPDLALLSEPAPRRSGAPSARAPRARPDRSRK